MKYKKNLLVLLTFCSLFGQRILFSQTIGTPFNQRDDQYPLLGLKRAKEAFEYAKSDYDRKLKMFEKALISQQELEQSKNNMADAEVNYQQSMLAVLFEKQYVIKSDEGGLAPHKTKEYMFYLYNNFGDFNKIKHIVVQPESIKFR